MSCRRSARCGRPPPPGSAGTGARFPRRAILIERAHAVVANRREMRGGARGHSAADRAAVDHDDRAGRPSRVHRRPRARQCRPRPPRCRSASLPSSCGACARPPAASTAIGWPRGLAFMLQPAAFRFTFFSAMPVSFLSAAFSSLSVVVKSLRDRLLAEFLGPGDQRAVAGDLVVLDRLGGCDQRRVQHLLVRDLAGDLLGFLDDSVDRRASRAFRILVRSVRTPARGG